MAEKEYIRQLQLKTIQAIFSLVYQQRTKVNGKS